MCSGTGRASPGVWQVLWGVLGWGRVGLTAQKALVVAGTVSGLGLRLNRGECPSAHLEALWAGTCTAAAGSGPAFSELLPAPVPSGAFLPGQQ